MNRFFFNSLKFIIPIFFLFLYIFPISAMPTTTLNETNKLIEKNQKTGNELPEKITASGSTPTQTWLGNSVLLKGIFSYSQYDFNYINLSDKAAFGIGIEHTSRFTKTQELVLGIEEIRLKNNYDYQYNILRDYTFSWRYHIPYFFYKNYYSLFATVSWGVYDLWAHNFSSRLRSGAWSFELGNRFYIQNLLIFQLSFGLRSLQFFFPEHEKNKELMDSFIINAAIGIHYINWK